MRGRADRNGSVVDGPLAKIPARSLRSMVRVGRRDGRSWRLHLGLPPLAAQTPYPARDNPGSRPP